MQGGATSGQGGTAQLVESHHQVLRLQDHALWNNISHHGDCAQVCIRLSHCGCKIDTSLELRPNSTLIRRC